MSRTNFYKWIKGREDVSKREGKRKKYQKSPIPLTHDYDHPVHGVQPHEVVYCDHTILNIFCKGARVTNLGKPTLTLMTDGALSMPRAFVLLFSPPSTLSVLMALRDYVRRWNRLPRVLVMDNGKEFHSKTLQQFCSLFNIEIRWRRRSKPRDSTLVERALGAVETEVIGNLDGNTVALKNPREVSSEVLPDKFITWTLPALHGALQHYLFNVAAKRIHPRFGISPEEEEKRLLLEYGSRDHSFVTFNSVFKLLTSPSVDGLTRQVDPKRGVWVDGIYYWNDRLAAFTARRRTVEVRQENWNASVVYVLVDGKWVVAHARDGSRVEGRFAREVEEVRRTERRMSKSLSQADRSSKTHALEFAKVFDAAHWDEGLREQCVEEHRLYSKLGMVEVMPEAINRHAAELDLGVLRSSDLDLIRSDERTLTAAATVTASPAQPDHVADAFALQESIAEADDDFF